MNRPAAITFALEVSVQSLRAQPPEELEQAARGILFVSTPAPPRVGSNIELDLLVAPLGTQKVSAFVVWSRPARLGTTAGFRAQITKSSPEVAERLRAVIEQAVIAGPQRRAPMPQKTQIPEGAIEERITIRDVTSPVRVSRPPPTRPPVTASIPPPRQDDLALDLVEREAKLPETPTPKLVEPLPPPVMVLEDLPPLGPAFPPITVTFSSHRNYLLHYEQFLEKGEVYVAGQAALAVGASLELVLEVPDDEAPLKLAAVIERSVKPPVVPEPGWVARFEDPSGDIGERLATATFIVSAPFPQ